MRDGWFLVKSEAFIPLFRRSGTRQGYDPLINVIVLNCGSSSLKFQLIGAGGSLPAANALNQSNIGIGIYGQRSTSLRTANTTSGGASTSVVMLNCIRRLLDSVRVRVQEHTSIPARGATYTLCPSPAAKLSDAGAG